MIPDASRWLLHRPPQAIDAKAAIVASAPEVDDSVLVQRIIDSYNLSARDFVGASDSMWTGYFHGRNHDIHHSLLDRDHAALTRAFRDPGSTNLFFGFNNLHVDAVASYNKSPVYQQAFATRIYDALRRFGEAIAALRIENPETYETADVKPIPVEDILAAIDAKLGVTVTFPNPYRHEFGLHSSRGVISYRSVNALYQSWRCRKLTAGVPSPKVMDLGAGIGKGALYAGLLGVTNYTIIDLPFTNVSQAYYLGRVLGEDRISLYGEPSSPDKVAILPTISFETCGSFDLVMNFDSFTEMGRDVASAYMSKMGSITNKLLSVNHEFNKFRVVDLIEGLAASHDRFPYWIRRGYVEEIVTFR